MRLWHYKLIPALPRQQLLGQWRECCLIAKNIAEKGTPDHILVDPIIEYDLGEFLVYCKLVRDEMRARGYFVNENSLLKHIPRNSVSIWFRDVTLPENAVLFPMWHTNAYLIQCFYNLEEKHDRGGITDEEWHIIQDAYIQAAGKR